MLRRLALAAEYRDDDTAQHTERVGHLAARLAARLDLGDDDVALIRDAAPLHDIGKLAIPDAILLKPDKLTADEFEAMKSHTIIGAQILTGSTSDVLQMAERIAMYHHERWDGGGYPLGLEGEHIPLVGRIVAVVDVYDALTHDRPYKSAWSHDKAMALICDNAGSQFDPRVVAAFRTL
jgi:putative two-component system response regulator